MGMNGERERDLPRLEARPRRRGEGDLLRDLESSVEGDREDLRLCLGDLLCDLDLERDLLRE